MNDMFTIELPKTIAAQQLSDLESEVAKLAEVDDAGTLDSRSIDPAMLGLWIQAATGILGVISTAVPLVQKVVDMIRKKGIKGAKLRFEGGEIEVDNISIAELKTLLGALGQKEPAKS
jgi:hypothetical protein